MPAPGRTPLARLHDTARQAGIIVVDAVDDDGPLLDDDTAAFVACGVCIALSPGLDDGLRTDVLAMALALTYAMSPGKTDHAGDITAADGFVLISRTHEAEPVSALGLLATVIVHEHGRDTASAAFEYTVPVFELARHAAESAPLAAAGGHPAGSGRFGHCLLAADRCAFGGKLDLGSALFRRWARAEIREPGGPAAVFQSRCGIGMCPGAWRRHHAPATAPGQTPRSMCLSAGSTAAL